MQIMDTRIPYYIVFFIALFVSFLLTVLAWRNRKVRGASAFALTAFLETLWLAGYILELASNTLDAKLFWDNFQYIGALFAPISLFIFSLQFTRRKFDLRRWLVPLLSLAVLFQVLIFANTQPEWIHIEPAIRTGMPFDELTYGFGVVTMLANAYIYFIGLAYIGVLIAGFFNKNLHRPELLIITIGTAIPIIAAMLGLMLEWRFANQRDIAPLILSFSNLVIGWGIFRKKLFNIAPIARDMLFEKMSNILVILDKNDRVIDLNIAALKFFGANEKDELLRTHISLLAPELYQEFARKLAFQTEITDNQGHTFSFDVQPLYNKNGVMLGRLINANDITEQKQISARLSELNTQNELRARRLNAITETSQTISQIRDLDTLLPVVTRQISERFDFYHVGIFLFSLDKVFVELIAANSDGGKEMLENGHKLEVGQVGVVGRVAAEKKPRVALDVGQDAVYFDNPYLPETHSEMALPLMIGKEIIGVLDVQSKQKNIFSKEDTEVFGSLANQVAIAINNARQVEATQAALEEARSLTQEYVREAWEKLHQSQEKRLGYRFVNNAAFPIHETSELASTDKPYKIEFPVVVHSEEIGVIKLHLTEEDYKKITRSDENLLAAIGERAGLALESARLLDETQKRAQREALVSNISAKIGASIRMDNIIQTTLRELGDALDVSEVTFQLTSAKDGEA